MRRLLFWGKDCERAMAQQPLVDRGQIEERQQTMKDMEDYLARIERINRVVGGIMDEVKTGKPRAEPEAAESKPQATRYSADYSRWEKIDAELEEQEKKEKKESEEMALCREEADRSKQMGNKKFGEGHYAEAHEAYSRAIILEPDNIVHPLNRALCNIKLCRWEQALKDCETVLKEEPHNPKALKRKATVLQNTEQFEAALGVWERVLKMNPRSVEAKDNILWVKKEMSERGKLQQFVESASSGLVDKLQDLLGRFVKAVGEYLAAECSAREAAASAPAPGDAGPAATPEPAPEGTPTSAPGPAAPAPGGAGTASPDAAAERSARVLACLGLLPELLLEDGAQIYFRVHGGQRALLDLLGHIIGREGPLGAILGLVVEGAYEALGYLLPNESNLAMVVEAEKKAVDGGRAALSLVSHAVYCVTEGEPPVSRAAMHFIATATAHAWVCAHLRRLLSAAQMCAFPTHGMSGRTLAFIAKIIDNCLRTAAWQEEFEAVDVLGFLMRFARAEYPILRQNVAGCVMRLTTVDGYRAKLLETSEGGAYRHVPALVQMFKAEVIPKGSRTVAFRAGFVVEAVLSAFINCMTLCPEQRRALCDALRPEGVFEDAVALAVSYTGERGAVEGAALPVVCRSLNLLAKCVAFREVLELVWGSEALMRSLPALANGFGLVVAEPGAPEGDAAQYQEGIVENCTIILGSSTKEVGGEDITKLLLPEWSLLTGLLTHPSNNICGNVALTLANLAEQPGAATTMGRSKVKVVDLLLDAIKARRNESFQAADRTSFVHPKNTSANNQTCQMNCAIALAKLAKDEANRDRLRELQGMEILHTVLQSRR